MTTMVAGKHIYDVNAQWGPRLETADALARRWLALVERLRLVDPALAEWTHWEKGRGLVPFESRLEAQVARVIDATERHIDGHLVPGAGTRIWNSTYPCPRSRLFTVNMRAGKDYGCNQIIAGTDVHAIPDPQLVSYHVLRGVLLAQAETFEATQVRAYPTDLRQFWTNTRGIGEELDLAWISYVAPRFASLVTPPPSVIVEHRPDGGLLMAATAEPFSTADPAHMAAAGKIKAALEPFNAVPWTPETGK